MNRKKYALIPACFAIVCAFSATPIIARKAAPKHRAPHKTVRRVVTPKPDNATGKIVFLRDGGFHIMNLDGSRQEVLPKDRLFVGQNFLNGGDRFLTPDGTHIVNDEMIMPRNMFSSESSFSSIHYILSTKNVRTSKVAMIFDAYGRYAYSLVSPDSKRIAYTTGENHNPYVSTSSLFVSNLDGSDNRKIAVNAPPETTAEGKTIVYVDDDPFFSSDGTTLFFTHFPNYFSADRKPSEIAGWYQVKFDGSEPQKLLNNPARRNLSHPSSPDGKLKVFQGGGDRCKDVFDIYIKSVNTMVRTVFVNK